MDDFYEDCLDEETPADADLAELRAFGDRTLIATARGPVQARALRADDVIRSKTGEYIEIDWIEKLRLDAAFLARHPTLRPVLLCQGDLGQAPARNTVLSAGQMVWDDEAGYRPAGELTRHPGLLDRDDLAVDYVVFQCRKPTVVEADGLWVSVTP